MRLFDYKKEPEKLLTSEIVRMVSSIHEHKGKQELFLEANIDELKRLLEVALIQSTGASNRIEICILTLRKLLEGVIKMRIMSLPKQMQKGIKRHDLFRFRHFRPQKRWRNFAGNFGKPGKQTILINFF